MTDQHDNVKRPHGETGDTVQQAAEVSKPTSPMGNAQGAGTNGGGPGGSDTGSPATPGQGNAR